MAGPLEGISAIDLGFWVAGPSVAGLLADWGADVIKIEPPTGDPLRGIFAAAAASKKWDPATMNPPFELDNRGKRSIALDLTTEDGRRIAISLIERTDVLVTNLRPMARERLALTYDDVKEANPRLIYCEVTGYGPDGEERNRAGYDIGAFWSRAGVAATITPKDQPLPMQPGAIGDHVVAQAAAGAVCAALVSRDRTGQGQRVAVSILRTGIYTLGWDTSIALRGIRIRPATRSNIPNPLVNCYQTADDAWLWLILVEADRHWPGLCHALEREDLRDDPRFADIVIRRTNAAELIVELDKVFRTRTRAEWGEIFDRENVWWAPVQTLNEVIEDPVAHAAGAFIDVPTPDGPVKMVASPADFYGTPWQPRGPAPEVGQHTEEMLLELGYDWDQISDLKERSVIP